VIRVLDVCIVIKDFPGRTLVSLMRGLGKAWAMEAGSGVGCLFK